MNARQSFLDRINAKEIQKEKSKTIVINWNIRNPSLLRAVKQTNWLLKTDSDIIILTEIKISQGCTYIKDRLESFGYSVVFPRPKADEYGVLVASRLRPTRTDFPEKIDCSFRARVVSVSLPVGTTELEIIAIYVPNERSEKKKHFLQSLLIALKNASPRLLRVFCGDFNVLEPGHVPFYPKFEDWEYNFYTDLSKYQLKDAFRHLNPGAQEYSWVGRTGDGYRYDHCFVSHSLLPLITKCHYLHEPRTLKLSDHSAMFTEIVYPKTI